MTLCCIRVLATHYLLWAFKISDGYLLCQCQVIIRLRYVVLSFRSNSPIQSSKIWRIEVQRLKFLFQFPHPTPGREEAGGGGEWGSASDISSALKAATHRWRDIDISKNPPNWSHPDWKSKTLERREEGDLAPSHFPRMTFWMMTFYAWRLFFPIAPYFPFPLLS